MSFMICWRCGRAIELKPHVHQKDDGTLPAGTRVVQEASCVVDKVTYRVTTDKL